MRITTYRQLDVWQRAMELVKAVYQVTKSLPESEKFGLTSQLQRAVVSIPSNIAEGWGRNHRREYLHHLSFARGSLMEVETLLIIAKQLALISGESIRGTWDLSQEVGKMLTALIASLRNGIQDE